MCERPASKQTLLWSTEDGKNWREELDFDLSRSYSRILWQNDRAYCASDESSSCGEGMSSFVLNPLPKVQNQKRLTSYLTTHTRFQGLENRSSHLPKTGPSVCSVSRNTTLTKCRRWLVPSRSYATGRLGVSEAPYKEWKWTPTKLQFGAPNLLILKDQRC